MALFSYLSNWWRKPFDPNGSATNWGLFVFLILMFILLWAQVLGPVAARGVRKVQETV